MSVHRFMTTASRPHVIRRLRLTIRAEPQTAGAYGHCLARMSGQASHEETSTMSTGPVADGRGHVGKQGRLATPDTEGFTGTTSCPASSHGCPFDGRPVRGWPRSRSGGRSEEVCDPGVIETGTPGAGLGSGARQPFSSSWAARPAPPRVAHHDGESVSVSSGGRPAFLDWSNTRRKPRCEF
jgi:hypothetical protein